MEKNAEFLTSISEIVEVKDNSDFNHPLLTMAKFILADDKGNGNNQGIEVDDFEEVIKTAVDMPIKMRYTGKKAGGHFGSVPIGHIKKVEKQTLEDGRNILMAWAVLYKDEYPKEVEYLMDAFASGEAPGISYEIKYKDSVVKNGVQWLKQLVTKAATIVQSPAYGNRTAILALASDRNLSDEDFNQEILNLITPPDDKGGSKMDEDKKKIEELEAAAATKDSEIATLKQQLTELQGNVTTLTQENEGLKKAALLESRVRAYTEAGFTLEADAEKATKKKDFLVSMSEEVFTEYLADLKAIKEAAKPKEPVKDALASLRGNGVPKLTPMEKEVPLDDLKGALRKIARGESE